MTVKTERYYGDKNEYCIGGNMRLIKSNIHMSMYVTPSLCVRIQIWVYVCLDS